MAQDQQSDPLTAENTRVGSVLHRKAASGRAEHQARAMTLARALRLSLVKVADDAFDLAVAVLGLRKHKIAHAELPDVFDDASLLVLLEGTGRSCAAVVMEASLVTALIQQQTMGQVMAAQDDQLRDMTATDAAICAPFLEAVVARAAVLPESDKDRELIEGYRYGARAEDGRVLHLSMDAAKYEAIEIDLDVERGSRQGKLVLCFPIQEGPPEILDIDSADHVTGPAGPEKSLADVVPALPVELALVLSRIKMPLRKIGGLRVGDCLTLDGADFEAVEIRAGTNRIVGQGTLGQLDGRRAVRVAHRAAPTTTPQRRASDRPGLGQPQLEGHDRRRVEDMAAVEVDLDLGQDLPAVPEPLQDSDLAALPELPDMSDIPDFEGLDLPDVAQG